MPHGAQGIIGLIFVQNETGATVTVTQGIYQQVLVNFKRELRRRCGDQLNVQWFQQDGAPPHTAKAALEWLKEHFPAGESWKNEQTSRGLRCHPT